MQTHARKLSVDNQEDLRLNPRQQSRRFFAGDSNQDFFDIEKSQSHADAIGSRFKIHRKEKKNNYLKTPMMQRQATKRISQQPKGTIISVTNHQRRGSLFLEFQDILKEPSIVSVSSSSSSDDSFKKKVKRQKENRFSSKLIHDRNPNPKKPTLSSIMNSSGKNFDSQQSKKLQSITSVLQSNMHGSKRMIGLKESVSTIKRVETLQRQPSNQSKMSHFRSMKQNDNMEMSVNRNTNNMIDSMMQSSYKKQSSSKSIMTETKTKSKAQILEILEKNPLFSELQRKKYLELLEQLENSVQTDDHSKRQRMQRKVRNTFVQMVNHFHQSDQGVSSPKNLEDSNYNLSQQHIGQDSMVIQSNMSVFSDFSILGRSHLEQNKKNTALSTMLNSQQMQVRHPSTNAQANDQVHLNELEKLDNAAKIHKLMEFYIEEMNHQENDDTQTLQESEFDGEFDIQSSSASQLDPTHVRMNKEIKKYMQLYARNPHMDQYCLFLKNEHGFESLKNDFQIYSDGYPLLTLRKIIVYFIGSCSQVSFRIISHKFYDFGSMMIILTNMYLFGLDHLRKNNDEQVESIYEFKTVLLYFYLIENCLRITGMGVVKFSQNMWNVYDLFLLFMYAFYLIMPQFMPYDISSFRLIRILLFFGLFNKPLNIMLISLSQAFTFLMEATIIMMILGVFFALQGLHLFSGLVRNVCMVEENGLLGEKRFCGFESCPEGQFCGQFTNNPEVPSNFDNFGYAWGQVLRVIVMNEWHQPMYESMETFHPGSFILFILIIFYGIFGSNLIIAVLKIYYSETMEKYEHEDIQQTEDERYMGAECNLMVLKQYGLYDELQNTLKEYIDRNQRKKMLYRKTMQLKKQKQDFASPSPRSILEGDNQSLAPQDQPSVSVVVDEEGKSKKLVARKSVFRVKKKMRHFLSARQNKLYKDQQDQLRGIETEIKNHHWLAQLLDSISLKNILLPRKTLQDSYIKTIDDNNEINQDEQCIPIMYKLKNNEILAWIVKVKHSSHLDYTSTSENDVLSLIHKERKKEDKRAREFEFIRKSNPQHLYIIAKKEILKAQKNYQQEMSLTHNRQKRYRRHHFPILQGSRVRQKTVKIRLLTIAGNRNMVQIMESPRERKPSLFQYNEMTNSYKNIESLRSKYEKLTLNGVEYDFEEVRKMIERPLGKENDEIPDDNLAEDLYVDFRKEEAKQSYAMKNNWSAEDVLQDYYGLQRKVFIFKALNRIDTIIWLKGISGFYQVVQKYVIKTMRYRAVEIFFDISILTNIVILALDGYISQADQDFFNQLITIFLGIELSMKLISQDIKKYVSKKVNIIECLIVLSCLSEIFVSNLIDETTFSPGLQLFFQLTRGFKAILFYRIIQYNNFAMRMAYITEKIFPLFSNLIVLMFFIILMFAFFGIELFRGKFPQEEQLGQLHSYDDIFKAWMSTFLIGTNDDWYGVVILGTTYADTYITIIYQTLLLFLLNFMTFGLFIAIILDGFSKYLTREEDDLQPDQDPYHINTEVSEDIKDLLNDGITLNSHVSQSGSLEQDDHENTLLIQKDHENEEVIPNSPKFEHQQSYLNIEKEASKSKYFDIQISIDQIALACSKEFIYYENVDCEDSLFLFNKENPVRKFCYKLVMLQWYQKLLTSALFLSLINMAIFTYFDHNENGSTTLIVQIIKIVELSMNAIVLADSILMIISLGFCLEKGSFSSELWRTLDFIYVVTFMMEQIFHADLHFFIFLTYFKYIRPMRFLNLNQGVKEVKDALAESLPDLLNVLFVQMLVWLIFAIFGVILYKGRLGYCEHSMNFGVGKQQCLNEGKKWEVFVHNFEDILQAISSLYIICTLDLWGPIFQICFNSSLDKTGPMPFANQWATYIFFFLFILVGAFFFLGFFTGILFIYFQENRAKLINAELTEEQTRFLQISAQIMIEKPQYSDPPVSFVRLTASKIIMNEFYKFAIPPLLFFNTVVLALFYHDQSYKYFSVLNSIHHTFASLLILDTFMKLTAYGFVRYFGLAWRKFEFIISVFSFVDLILDKTLFWTYLYYYSTVNDQYFIPLRLLFFIRDFRVLLIIQYFQGLTRLMRILAFSMPYLLKILSLFFSILLIYAYAGCYLFGTINKGEIMDDYLNFKNVFLAILTLFKCSTRNNWRQIMVDCTPHNPYCSEDSKQCGQPMLLSQLYFYSFILISSLIVFQLFVLALVEQLEGFYNSQNNVIQTYIENIDKFRTVWAQFSFETKGKKMHTKNLASFLMQLGEPLGCMVGDNTWDAAKSAANFHIKSDALGYVHFQEVLYETIRYAYKEEVFHTGSKNGIQQMKLHDKNIRFRLHHRRLSLRHKRTPIQPKIYLTSNFNVMQDYIYVLQTFRSWLSYSHKILQKATVQKLQGQMFSESVEVSFDEKDEAIDNDQDLYEAPYEVLQDIYCQKHLVSDEDLQEDVIQLDKYVQRKNTAKKQKVRLQFLTDQLDHPQAEDDHIFEPADIFTQNRGFQYRIQSNDQQPLGSASNIKPKKSNLKQNLDRRRSNLQQMGDGASSLMVVNLPDSQYQAFGSAISPYGIQVKTIHNPLPNPMSCESESDLSKVMEADFSVGQIVDDEGELKSIRDTFHQFIGKPTFTQNASQASISNDYDRVRTDTYASLKNKQYNLQNLKKQKISDETPQKNSNRPKYFSQFK